MKYESKLSATTCLTLLFAFLCVVFFAQDVVAHETTHAVARIRHKAFSPGHTHKNLKKKSHFKHINVLVTAYLISRTGEDQPGYRCPAYTNKTADGDTVHYGSAAVDPHYFRFGTKFYIPGYGTAIADDTGGAIKGCELLPG